MSGRTIQDHSEGDLRGDCDVAIVGYGPVGQALAACWARRPPGACSSATSDLPPTPGPAHLDHEVMRILQALGLADELAGELLPIHGTAGSAPTVSRSARSAPTPSVSGWEPDYLFFQPQLESALDAGRAPAVGGRAARLGASGSAGRQTAWR